MNFFGRKNVHFDEEDDFYDAPMEKSGTLEKVDEDEEETAPAAKSFSASNASVGLGGGSIELKVVHPEKYEDVVSIAECLLNHQTVVLNLESANKDVSRRMLDFLSGVAFSIGGQVRRVTNDTYIITPSNVDVSDTRVSPAGLDED